MAQRVRERAYKWWVARYEPDGEPYVVQLPYADLIRVNEGFWESDWFVLFPDRISILLLKGRVKPTPLMDDIYHRVSEGEWARINTIIQLTEARK